MLKTEVIFIHCSLKGVRDYYHYRERLGLELKVSYKSCIALLDYS